MMLTLAAWVVAVVAVVLWIYSATKDGPNGPPGEW